MPATAAIANKSLNGESTRRKGPEKQEFPFGTVLSLEPLIAYVRESMCRLRDDMAPLRDKIEEALAAAPELNGPIHDLSVIDRYREVVDLLMSVIFPPANWDRESRGAIVPYTFTPFYHTPAFSRLLIDSDGDRGSIAALARNEGFVTGRTLSAYLWILRRFYDISVEFAFPVIATVPDPDTGLERYYKLEADVRFQEVHARGPVEPLTDEQRARILDNLSDLDMWRDIIPTDMFEFTGFAVINAIDMTDQQVVSELTRELIRNDAIVSFDGFERLQSQMRTLLRRPGLFMSIAALEGEELMVLNYGAKVKAGCVFTDAMRYKMKGFSGSIYQRAFTGGNIEIIENLDTYPAKSQVEESMILKGYRNVLVAPLKDEKRVIGSLTLWSAEAGDIDSLNSMKLIDILPLFSIAVQRSMDDLRNRVQRVIRQEYTAIHPSVEWRFRKASFNYIRQQDLGERPVIEPIVFADVYPLFGESDIRNSSVQRNEAIQHDLIEQLDLARDVVGLARTHRDLPILDNVSYKLGKISDNLKGGLHSGDEGGVLDMLKTEIEPLFTHLAEFDPEIAHAVENYRAMLDSDLGILHNKRRDFEESVNTLTRLLASYIDGEERRAQAMFPHYFEQHTTDGVDFGMYVGASLNEKGVFDPIYLKNLRLWQLMVLCGSAREAERIRPKLKIPLEMTHLILVQSIPLSIRFLHDEKQFGVDGAYNIRYEIMKKRIDKATIIGTDERLTQPGRIAIVYSQAKEAHEYREYIEYLQSTGELEEEVEDVELEPLQGIQGLRALRVAVVGGQAPAPTDRIDEAVWAVSSHIEG